VAVDDALGPPDPERGRADDGADPADDPALVLAEVAGGWALRGRVPAPRGAADADRCLCGVRTIAGRRDAEGVAVVAADLGAAGVNRPEGDAADLVFDDAVVTDDELVGGRDQGWPVLQSVRARMRSVRWITSLLAIQRALAALGDVVRSRGLTEDGAFRDRVAGLQVEADAVRALAYRALAKQESGRPNPELAMLPLATAQVEERVYLAGVDALGADGLDMGLDGPMGWPSGSWAAEWTTAADAAATAGGVGAERDRIAARVLGFRLG
jgi:alkylation response protein AidB-like acyl-CoA dehydrogenase